jgi:hypothetical protein
MASDREQYTQTGGGFFDRMSNFFSYVPILGAPIAVVAGWVGAAVDSAKWLVQGKVFSAATALIAGGISATVNGLGGFGSNWDWFSRTILGTANIGSGLATGETLGTHARKVTEIAIGGFTGLVGRKPTVLQSHYAGIGGINGGFNRQGPGPWANYVSQRTGRDPNQQWSAYVNAQRAEAGQMQAQR